MLLAGGVLFVVFGCHTYRAGCLLSNVNRRHLKHSKSATVDNKDDAAEQPLASHVWSLLFRDVRETEEEIDETTNAMA